MLAALPVRGESFALRRNSTTVLVDGGFKGDNVHTKLNRAPGGINIGIVICTHGDRDHAGGLPKLIDARKKQIQQIWLPGRFAGVIRDLMLQPGAFLDDLCDELKEELRSPSEPVLDLANETDFISIEDEWSVVPNEVVPQVYGQNLFNENNGEINNAIPTGGIGPLPEPEWISEIRNAIKSKADRSKSSTIFDGARKIIRDLELGSDLDSRNSLAQYWLALICTAEAIRGIAMAAIKNKILIRWFDYEAFSLSLTRQAIGGIPGYIVPVNSVELVPSPLRREKNIYMELTKINKESLVFFAPARTSGELDVLFCADSPLGDGPGHNNIFPPHSRNSNCLVATAPHHGSESNKIAYDHLKAWGGVSIFLRAGGSKTCPPGATFGKQAALKLCAKCPENIKPRFTGLHWGQKGLICFSSNVCQCWPAQNYSDALEPC